MFQERWNLYKDSVECGLLVGFGTWLQSVESDWVFLLQGKKVVKLGSGCDLVGCRSCLCFWGSLFMVFWAGILAVFFFFLVSTVAIPSIKTTIMEG